MKICGKCEHWLPRNSNRLGYGKCTAIHDLPEWIVAELGRHVRWIPNSCGLANNCTYYREKNEKPENVFGLKTKEMDLSDDILFALISTKEAVILYKDGTTKKGELPNLEDIKIDIKKIIIK